MNTPFTRFTVLLTSFLLWPSVQQAVEINKEAGQRIGLRTAPLAEMALAPSTPVYATVLAPAPLIDLYRQSEAAEVAAGLSKDALNRAEKLFASGELVARKDVDAARGQQIQSEALIRSLEDRIALEWGTAFAALKPDERTLLVTGLLGGKQALVRLALPRREWIEQPPTAATLLLPGRENKPLRTTRIHPSTMTDPVYQAQTFLAVFEVSGTVPAPGANLTGALELAAENQKGLLIPESAAVLFQGRAWIYRKQKEEEFERVEFPTTQPAPGGWWVADSSMEPGEVVISGAQALLSKEATAAKPPEGE